MDNATTQKPGATRYDVYYRSDLYYGQCGEDGEQAIHEEYTVYAQAPDGRRWAMVETYRTGTLGRARAKAEADRKVEVLSRAVASGKWLGPVGRVWKETQPCYGSEAYDKDWTRYAAADDLADGNFEPGSARESELRERAQA